MQQVITMKSIANWFIQQIFVKKMSKKGQSVHSSSIRTVIDNHEFSIKTRKPAATYSICKSFTRDFFSLSKYFTAKNISHRAHNIRDIFTKKWPIMCAQVAFFCTHTIAKTLLVNICIVCLRLKLGDNRNII